MAIDVEFAFEQLIDGELLNGKAQSIVVVNIVSFEEEHWYKC